MCQCTSAYLRKASPACFWHCCIVLPPSRLCGLALRGSAERWFSYNNFHQPTWYKILLPSCAAMHVCQLCAYRYLYAGTSLALLTWDVSQCQKPFPCHFTKYACFLSFTDHHLNACFTILKSLQLQVFILLKCLSSTFLPIWAIY